MARGGGRKSGFSAEQKPGTALWHVALSLVFFVPQGGISTTKKLALFGAKLLTKGAASRRS